MLLGMQWEDRKNFNAVADTLHWIAKHHGVTHLWHYLDDFLITCGQADSDEYSLNLQLLLDICRMLDIPIGPATLLWFLGILIDTIRGELRLPADKLERLQQQV